jgi:hypothetical protein
MATSLELMAMYLEFLMVVVSNPARFCGFRCALFDCSVRKALGYTG